MNKFEKHIESIIKEIKEIFRDNLVSVILYGSYIKGGYVYKKSDINLMIIRKKRDTGELTRLNKFYRKYFFKFKLSLPLVLTADEIKTSTDVYPMEYMDIKNHHKLLYGRDIFKDLKIGLTNLRLELENQIKSKLIYLRESLVRFYKNRNALKFTALNSLSSLIIILKNIIELNKKEVPAAAEEIISEVSELTGFKLNSSEKLMKYKKGGIKYNNNELLLLYRDYISEFERLADYADKFKVKRSS